jgi:hypothetical protein
MADTLRAFDVIGRLAALARRRDFSEQDAVVVADAIQIIAQPRGRIEVSSDDRDAGGTQIPGDSNSRS